MGAQKVTTTIEIDRAEDGLYDREVSGIVDLEWEKNGTAAVTVEDRDDFLTGAERARAEDALYEEAERFAKAKAEAHRRAEKYVNDFFADGIAMAKAVRDDIIAANRRADVLVAPILALAKGGR